MIMKTLQQRYSEISFDNVHKEIVDFHANQQYALLKYLRRRSQLLPREISNKAQYLIGQEIELWPGTEGEVALPKPLRSSDDLNRDPSPTEFSDKDPIGFELIKQFLSDALTYSEYGQTFKHRMYPSGGALYPVEIFLLRLSDNIIGWPDSWPVFHIKPNSRSLESIENDSCCDLSELRDCLSGYDDALGKPHFALFYTIFLDKVLFKYKRRGYRNALMEAGSIYQICDLYSKKFGLRNRVWSGFHDGSVAQRISIDATSLLPCVVQFFGK